jgi:hypothetical protein
MKVICKGLVAAVILAMLGIAYARFLLPDGRLWACLYWA